MGALLSAAALTSAVLSLNAGEHYADPVELVEQSLDLFVPPEAISTVDWAEQYRKFRTTDGGALVPYDRWRTPYNIAKMDALDEPGVELVVVVKPSRSGGTTVFENYLGKMIDFGPMGPVCWYLGSEGEVKKYCERVIAPLFEDHPRLAKKIGSGRSDDNATTKKISGQLVEFLAANSSGFTNREFLYGVMDEPDGWARFGEGTGDQLQARQKQVGKRRKGGVLSHPDKGWVSGVASEWETSSRGIYIMRCPDCGHFAAAHATKFWPGVPEFKLSYDRQKVDPETGEVRESRDLTVDERLELAETTAGISCPHCRAKHDDKTRFKMIDEAGREGWWMHRGQTLDVKKGIQGEPLPHTKRGFWDHGIMLKVSPAAELAKGLEKALIKYERSGGSRIATKKLREYMSKHLAEIFEGKSALSGLDAAKLEDRTKELSKHRVKGDRPFNFRMGEVPPGPLFLTLSVDVAGDAFDILVRGWDTARRSWIIDRRKIRQREHENGVLRDIAPPKVQDDWNVLETELDRLFPLRDDPDLALPIACMTIDAGDGNVTWKAYEFARRMDKKCWGTWRRVRCIKGSNSKNAPALPASPTKISKDSEGRAIRPVVTLHTLGVHDLKEQALEDIAVNDGSPGMVIFPTDFPHSAYEELFNEPLIDGEWIRNGDNETLDLFGYSEAGRLMLEPDRKGITWDELDKRPAWARFVAIDEGQDDAGSAAESPRPSLFARFDALNKQDRR